MISCLNEGLVITGASFPKKEVGEDMGASFDKKTLKRLQDIHKLEPEVQEKLFFFIDTVIRDNKAKKAYS